ncbi:hypothetical protein JL101_035545 (plasmid) [Skermanella rosea]|uniref:hypothetical protein n=1 Tax=Skermanella rosea TaxID=1817965 RepID=UPI0019313564|nr:hypothetical protein [Skermanella rosea]UEM08114.1 hypothetical protein JL101_035545 [Skermanella rosea]
MSKLVVYLVEFSIGLVLLWLLFKAFFYLVMPRGVRNAVDIRRTGERYEAELRSMEEASKKDS